MDARPRFMPDDLVRAAARSTELAFSRDFGNTPFLAIRLAEGQEALEATLRSTLSGAQTVPAKHQEQLGFRTEIADPTALRRAMTESRPPPSLNPDVLANQLAGPHFLAALRKRADVDAAFANRISVGRATNTDIVLRDPSVSKFHAYFEVDDSDRFYVRDAGSKNGTTVDGVRVAAREPVEISSGSRIVFGSIQTMLLDARTLFRLLRY